MPTKRRRISVNLPPDLESIVTQVATASSRKLANQIEFIVAEWARNKMQEVELLKPTRLHAARQSDGIQVFQTPDVPLVEHQSKRRAKGDQDNT